MSNQQNKLVYVERQNGSNTRFTQQKKPLIILQMLAVGKWHPLVNTNQQDYCFNFTNL